MTDKKLIVHKYKEEQLVSIPLQGKYVIRKVHSLWNKAGYPFYVFEFSNGFKEISEDAIDSAFENSKINEPDFSFIDGCVNGLFNPNDINDFIEFWYVESDRKELRLFLGMTVEEYASFVVKDDNIYTIIKKRKAMNEQKLGNTGITIYPPKSNAKKPTLKDLPNRTYATVGNELFLKITGFDDIVAVNVRTGLLIGIDAHIANAGCDVVKSGSTIEIEVE